MSRAGVPLQSGPASPPPCPAAARRRQSRPAGHWTAAVAYSGIGVHVCTPLPLIAGSRGLRLLLFGIGLPLDLPSHLVVHTLCLAISLASLPQACTQQVGLKHGAPASSRHHACLLAYLPARPHASYCLGRLLPGMPQALPAAHPTPARLQSLPATLPPPQLLDSPLTGGRIAAFHRLMGVGMGGLLPLGYPPGGKHIECTSALVFMCGFLGWVLPTYAMLLRHGREARKQAAKTAAEAAEVLAAAAAEAARWRDREQPALAALAGRDTATSDPQGTAAAGVLSAGGAQGSRQSAALLRHPRMDATAAWLLSNIVLAGAPLEHRVTSWCILAVLCWLASTVVAVRVIA